MGEDMTRCPSARRGGGVSRLSSHPKARDRLGGGPPTLPPPPPPPAFPPQALSLCRYLEEQRFDFRGRTVIELGAGTGIVGILAALLGACWGGGGTHGAGGWHRPPPSNSFLHFPAQYGTGKVAQLTGASSCCGYWDLGGGFRGPWGGPSPLWAPPSPILGGDVTITDQPAALDQIRENVRLNFPVEGGRPQVRALLWGQDEGSFRPEYEVILGSDIVYHPPSFSPLLGTLRHLCGPRSFALLCAKMRGGDAGARRFFRQMLPPYFRIQLLRREAEEEIEIYRVTRRGDDPIEEGGDTHTTPAGCCSGGGCA